MIVRAVFLVIILSGLAIGSFGVLSIVPGEKRFKMDEYNTLEQGWRLQNPLVKQHLYGRLEGRGDVDYVTFTLATPTPVTISIKNPAGDAGFEPTIILFGPGLPIPNENPPIAIGEPNGAIVSKTIRDKQRPIFEPSELTTYLTGPTIRADLKKAGTYAVAIVTPSGEPGRYVLTIGSGAGQGIMDQIREIPPTVKALLRLY
ncbi:MAG: hypothetical protein WC787_00280 [Patescibacteria group bacterium]|jgi:hypothetical protein